MEKVRPKCARWTGRSGEHSTGLASLVAITTLLVTLVASPAAPQGRTDYYNVESPQGHPIEVFRLGGHDYIAVCNTRDNSVEILDTDEAAGERHLARLQVGLEPVSVRFNAARSELVTANFLGDSLSVIDVAAPDGPGSLRAAVVKTVAVTDEPIDVAPYDHDDAGAERDTLLVTHMALDGFSWLDADTLQPLSPGLELTPALVQVTFGGEDFDQALKEPRTVLVDGDQLVILGLKGGSNNLAPLGGDMDYYCDDLAAPFVNPGYAGNVGTTGMNMAFGPSGELYIVGAEALNQFLVDESGVAAAPTGFVKSMIYRIEDACGSPAISRRDVNLEPSLQQVPLSGQTDGVTTGPVEPVPIIQPVAKGKALSMLTDLAVFETAGVPKVFFTAFSNDRIGVVEPDPSIADPNFWPLRRINIPAIAGNPLTGPSGLALKPANPGQDGDPGARLYVLNHLDSSITTIDPVGEALVAGTDMKLTNDPRPAHLTAGQPFLYNAKLSGNGFSSCASCHIFARTDRRAWDLGDPASGDITIPSLLPDAIDDTVFPADKGLMITQSLQGLLNFELSRADQFWITNAPYHWRGDRASFLDFNGAFASLLGGSELSDEEMIQYEEFINTIHYPPNPKQARDRMPTGDFGSGEDLQADGSTGSMRGQKIFTVLPTVGQRSCAAGCHMGSEGSNNLLTEGAGMNQQGEPNGQPIETAALRGLFQKETRRDVDGTNDPEFSPFTGLTEALTHTGFAPGPTLAEINLFGSINFFNETFFEIETCDLDGDGVPDTEFCSDLQMLNQYTHQFDWGTGPTVGCVQTVDATNVANAYPGNPLSLGCAVTCTDLASSLDCMEEQADIANTGVAVQADLDGVRRGFYYNPVSGSYIEEPVGGSTFTRSALLDQVNDLSQLIFQAVPLGNERRVAAPSGVASDLPPAPAPTQIRLLSMVTNTMHRRIPELTVAWADIDNVPLESRSIHIQRLYQWGLIQDAPAENGFGLGTALRHDAPRRFRVSGRGIRHGSALVLAYPFDPDGPPDPQRPFGETDFALLSLPIYPTNERDPETGLPVWQTAAELEPMFYYSFMLGGPFAPNVATAFLDQKPFTFPMVDPVTDQPFVGAFDPTAWNWHVPFVLDSTGNFGQGDFQRLEID